MRCVFGHYVLGIWRIMYRWPGGGWICEQHAAELERFGIGSRTALGYWRPDA